MILLFLAIFLLSFINGAWLLGRLQNTHYTVWVSLGRPTFVMNNGIRPRLALVKYIWSLQFKKLNDTPLSVACWLAITAEPLLILIFLLFILGAAWKFR